MVLQLHVWGPAFGLPSIDPDCLGVVAYLNHTVPRNQWTLVADHDPSSGAQGQFPQLYDGNETISGFTNIISHIENHYSNASQRKDALAQKQRKDMIAFTSFLESTAGPLLDLYLYVSSENYNTTTSAALTAILPWFANFNLPPKRRDLARARTSHLGLSSLDVTHAGQDTSGPGRGTVSSEYEAAKRAHGIPTEDRSKALHMGRGRGVGGLLGSPIYAARFKLDGLSNELLQPLAEQLGKKEYITGGDSPSSLDCLAFGYLALLRYAPVPQAWIQETIQKKHPTIEIYIDRLWGDLLHKEKIRSEDVWSVTTGEAKASDLGLQLPWVARPQRAVVPQLLSALHTSFLPKTFQTGTITQHGCHNEQGALVSALPSSFAIGTLCTISSAAAVGLVALAIYHRKTPREGPLIFWAILPQQHVFDGFGVESFLGALPR